MLAGPSHTIEQHTRPYFTQPRTILSIAESFSKPVMADRACKCLNVRIRPQPHERTTSPQEDAEFEPLYVGEIGLTVVSFFSVL